MFGSLPNISAAAPAMASIAATPGVSGMFGAGKPKMDWAGLVQGLIGGYLAGRGNPMGSAILGMANQRQQAKTDEAQYHRRRKDALEDYGVKQQIEAQYSKPDQPHYFEDNSGNLMAVGPDGQPRMVHKDPLQWKLVPNGMGGVVPVNIQQLMGGQAGQPPQTLSDDDWPTQGGPTLGGSGGFPRPY